MREYGNKVKGTKGRRDLTEIDRWETRMNDNGWVDGGMDW